ncbi:MAG: hypothetical protein K8U03_11610 [Planctomycetia bacterium]|nr:hypothetical protein [Planctomycetia bacterium]
MACYIVVGALATYGRGVVVGYLVGLLFASVLYKHAVRHVVEPQAARIENLFAAQAELQSAEGIRQRPDGVEQRRERRSGGMERGTFYFNY